MSFIIKMRGSTKNHLLKNATDTHTICGKKVKTGEILDELTEGEPLNLCINCYAGIGEKMAPEWFGGDFFVPSINNGGDGKP